MKGISIFVWVIGAIVLAIIGTFFAIIIILSSSKEIKLTDEVGKGISTINLFYLIQNIFEERVRLAINKVSLYIGMDCGGLDCGEHCQWCAEKPKLEDLKKEYVKRLKEEIDKIKFPENLGKFKLENPKLKEIRLREDEVEIEFESHIVSYNLNEFSVNASNGTITFVEKIKYPLFLKIGREFVENELTKSLDERLKEMKTSATMVKEGSCPDENELLALTDYNNARWIIEEILNDINSKDPYKKENCKAIIESFSSLATTNSYVTMWVSEEPPVCEGSADFTFHFEERISFVCIDENKKIPKENEQQLENLTLKFFVYVNSIVQNGKSTSVIISG